MAQEGRGLLRKCEDPSSDFLRTGENTEHGATHLPVIPVLGKWGREDCGSPLQPGWTQEDGWGLVTARLVMGGRLDLVTARLDMGGLLGPATARLDTC